MVGGAAVVGMTENEWKWNTMNKNVLSNTFLLVSSMFVAYVISITQLNFLFPLAFIYFYLFTTSKRYKLKKRNNKKQAGKPYKRLQGHVNKQKPPTFAASSMLISSLIVR